jgi:hypothetical protein
MLKKPQEINENIDSDNKPDQEQHQTDQGQAITAGIIRTENRGTQKHS